MKHFVHQAWIQGHSVIMKWINAGFWLKVVMHTKWHQRLIKLNGYLHNTAHTMEIFNIGINPNWPVTDIKGVIIVTWQIYQEFNGITVLSEQDKDILFIWQRVGVVWNFVKLLHQRWISLWTSQGKRPTLLNFLVTNFPKPNRTLYILNVATPMEEKSDFLILQKIHHCVFVLIKLSSGPIQSLWKLTTRNNVILIA